MEMSSKLCELMNRMREKETLYIGKMDIFLFHAYLNGFALACEEQLGDLLPRDNLGKFTEWIAKKYDVIATINWSTILFLNSYGDKGKALRQFYPEWDLFCEEMRHPERANSVEDDLS